LLFGCICGIAWQGKGIVAANMRFYDNAFHIVRGEGVGGVVRTEFGVPESRILVERDSLSFGPLIPLDDPKVWDRSRLDFWSDLLGAEPDEPTLWRQLFARREELATADATYLWLGPALDECLSAGFLLAAFERLELDASRLLLIDLDPVFDLLGAPHRLGGFNQDLLGLMGPWKPMDEAMAVCYRRLWRAATAPTPELVLGFCRPETPWPESLKEALRTWFAWYPAVKSGLGFWDELLLGNSSTTPVSVAHTLADCLRQVSELADPGDAWLFHRMMRLADPQLPWPLLEVFGNGENYRGTTTRLTEAGIDVLNGDENAIVLNGIEDRIGGVTLSLDRDCLWLYDGETLVPRGRIG
jgi:hypothetical protein